MNPFHYVYVLESKSNPLEFYIGLTDNLKRRLSEHNAGKVPHTSKCLPWKIRSATAFRDKKLAVTFEGYLKTGSGRSFLHRHL